jgi:pimeloyl-ACP methyl ester carboxylesterase
MSRSRNRSSILLPSGHRVGTWRNSDRSSRSLVVLLPGGPGLAAEAMSMEFDLVSPLASTVVLDPPNVGLSSAAPPNFDCSPQAHARWYATALDEMECEEIWLIGHSFGGMAALALCAERPELVRRCLCLSTRILGVDLDDPSESERTERILRRYEGRPWYESARETFDNWQQLVNAATSSEEIRELNRLILPFYSARADEPEIWKTIQLLADACYYDVDTLKAWENGLWQRFDLRGILPQIDTEVTFAGGDLDWQLSLAAMERSAALVKGAKWRVIDSCGHLVAVDASGRLREMVASFTDG